MERRLLRMAASSEALDDITEFRWELVEMWDSGRIEGGPLVGCNLTVIVFLPLTNSLFTVHLR